MKRIRRIRIADHRGRDATVVMMSIREAHDKRYRDTAGGVAHSTRRVRATEKTAPETLLHRFPHAEDLASALIEGDPEADLELAARATGPCDQVHLDGDGQVLYAPSLLEVRYDADGLEQARRPLKTRPANLLRAAPPRWSNVLLPHGEVIRGYALTRAYQLRHTNALEYDFLHELARYLDERKAMVQVGSGAQGTGPLRLERNGPAWRGFLDGRIQDAAMRLVLYLSAQALETSHA